MAPKTLVTTVAVVFVASVSTCLAMRAATVFEKIADLEFKSLLTSVATLLVLLGLAVGLGVGMVRGSVVERWTTALASFALAVGIFRNSGEDPAGGLLALGTTFALCGVALLTPLAGRHFSRNQSAGEKGLD